MARPKFKRGDEVMSHQNDITTYIVSKVNKESINVYVKDSTNLRFDGQEPELFYKVEKKHVNSKK